MNGQDALQWARNLGLAMSPLFGSEPSSSPGEHYAMLDGRGASFACSLAESIGVAPVDSRNWQWSADLAHHVLLAPEAVEVRSGREPQARLFRRSTVEEHLDDFLRYLDSSRRFALPDIVPFLVGEFRSLWGGLGQPDGNVALAAFLMALQAAGENDPGVLEDSEWRKQQVDKLGVDTDASIMLPGILSHARGMQQRAPLGLRLIPPLILRHAGGRLFQEAHAFLETAQLGLFGDADITTVSTYSEAGAYFTPVLIARLLAESALGRWSELPNELVIADFACGSAVFLTEALRVLERRKFTGKVLLVGRDKSAQAVTMAKVAVRIARRDIPALQVETDIREASALDATWPMADVVLMNPPFRSWERMSNEERGWVRSVIGGPARGRPDLSIAFVELAAKSVRPGGALATLIPAGMLASESMGKWRSDLLERISPSLIGVLGEHGLFRHALVNVGFIVGGNPPSAAGTDKVRIVWASPETGAAARALRAVRRTMSGLTTEQQAPLEEGWSVTEASLRAWKKRPSWLPGAGALGALLERLEATIPTKVEDLFHVRQGIRTGAIDVFVQSSQAVSRLPAAERRFFKPAVEAASFVGGEIEATNFLFVPNAEWSNESDVREAVPRFFESYLKPAREKLEKRKSVDPQRWWTLTRVRGWSFVDEPRLVSKRFGLYPAFARDPFGKFAVVQANAWTCTDKLKSGRDDEKLREVLTTYWWLLNSRVAVALFREFCPNVAGGQLDLEHKYVRHLPLPHLPQRIEQDPSLQLLVSSIRTRSGDELPSINDRDEFAASSYGTALSEWTLPGLEMPL